MKIWKRIAALCLSVSTVGVSLLSAACENFDIGFLSSSQGGISNSLAESSIKDNSSETHTHEWTEVVVKEATCTEDGKKVLQCECGEEKDEEVIPAGHSLIREREADATCMQEGLIHIYCENCEYETQEIESKQDHLYLFGGDCFWCGKSKDGIEGAYDVTKATLTVATFEGGVGKAWLDAAAKRFEELYKTSTHFEEGKMGVSISVDADKVQYVGSNLVERALTKDVYFTEGVDYYTLVSQNKVVDLSDIVSSPLNSYGECGTIEDKLDGGIKNYLTAKDGKYYMLPFYDGFYGFIYDVDLFEEEGFYFDSDGDFIGIDRGADDATRVEFEMAKSSGPDGIENTYDDGLPATYEQLMELLERIRQKGYIPFCYSGQRLDYVDKAFYSFIADYEGYDAMNLNYTFNGTAKVVDTVNDWEVTTKEVTITPDNGYELQKQAGKYYALKMQEELFGSTNYLGGSWNEFEDKDARYAFIRGKYTGERYAMLVEGVWWENASKTIIQEIEMTFGEQETDRRFGFLPIPKVDESYLGNQTMISLNNSFGFINKDASNMTLAKEFMRFLHTEAEMSRFSATTSLTRALNYHVCEEDRAMATHFGQSLIQMKNRAKVVYPYSSEAFVMNHPTHFDSINWLSTALIHGKTFNQPFEVFKSQEATAEEYFNGLYTYQQNIWDIVTR